MRCRAEVRRSLTVAEPCRSVLAASRSQAPRSLPVLAHGGAQGGPPPSCRSFSFVPPQPPDGPVDFYFRTPGASGPSNGYFNATTAAAPNTHSVVIDRKCMILRSPGETSAGGFLPSAWSPVSPSLQGIADTFGDLTGMRFQREMARVEEADDSPRNIALERLGTGRQKKRIILAPGG